MLTISQSVNWLLRTGWKKKNRCTCMYICMGLSKAIFNIIDNYIVCATDAFSSKRRRKLDMNEESSASKNDNTLWNEIHVSLVRDLERKGILWRYGTKHLKLWTDMIVDGRSSGIGEEPQWEAHLEQVIIPPRSRRSSSPGSVSSTSTNSDDRGMPFNGNLMEMFLLQNQQRMIEESKRTEMFQTTLLAMMSGNCTLFSNQVRIIVY